MFSNLLAMSVKVIEFRNSEFTCVLYMCESIELMLNSDARDSRHLC